MFYLPTSGISPRDRVIWLVSDVTVPIPTSGMITPGYLRVSCSSWGLKPSDMCGFQMGPRRFLFQKLGSLYNTTIRATTCNDHGIVCQNFNKSLKHLRRFWKRKSSEKKTNEPKLICDVNSPMVSDRFSMVFPFLPGFHPAMAAKAPKETALQPAYVAVEALPTTTSK